VWLPEERGRQDHGPTDVRLPEERGRQDHGPTDVLRQDIGSPSAPLLLEILA